MIPNEHQCLPLCLLCVNSLKASTLSLIIRILLIINNVVQHYYDDSAVLRAGAHCLCHR